MRADTDSPIAKKIAAPICGVADLRIGDSGERVDSTNANRRGRGKPLILRPSSFATELAIVRACKSATPAMLLATALFSVMRIAPGRLDRDFARHERISQ